MNTRGMYVTLMRRTERGEYEEESEESEDGCNTTAPGRYLWCYSQANFIFYHTTATFTQRENDRMILKSTDSKLDRRHLSVVVVNYVYGYSMQCFLIGLVQG